MASARGEDGAGRGTDGNPADNTVDEAGAAYVFGSRGEHEKATTMSTSTRRDHLKTLARRGGGAAARRRRGPRATAPVPPQGIGRRIRHLSYSDLGGRPDSVQIMLNRRHLYVGHMFSNGLTILDASDPRRLKPVGFFTGGDFTRTHHLQVADDLLLLANGANIVAMQSYDNLRGYFENSLADSITNRKKFRSGLSIHDISQAAGDAGDRVPRDAGAGHQPAVVAGRPLRLRVRRTSTASPITSCASSICRRSPSRRSWRAGGCPA